jgi:hypothetical protein
MKLDTFTPTVVRQAELDLLGIHETTITPHLIRFCNVGEIIRVVTETIGKSDFTQFMYGEPEVPALF